MEVVRTKIALLILDIVMHHSKVDLDEKQITWMINKTNLEDNLIYWFESNGYLPNSGTLCHEPTGFGTVDTNPSVRLPPKAKVRPQDTSGLSRRNPRARADASSSTRISQGAQYVASNTEDSDVAPSPTSAGATHTQIDPMGKCNFNNPPHPVMFDDKVHESSQILQLETYVLERHGVSLWRDLSVCTPICPSSHALNPIQLVDFLIFYSQARLAAAAPRASVLTASPLPVSGASLHIFSPCQSTKKSSLQDSLREPSTALTVRTALLTTLRLYSPHPLRSAAKS